MQRDIRRLVPIAILMLAFLALFTALDMAESVLSPIVPGIVTGIVMSPMSELWERWGFAALAGALSSLIVTLVAIGGIVLVMQPIVAQTPKVRIDMQDTIDTLTGTAGADRLEGNAGANILKGNASNDQFWGQGGDNFIFGGTGNDLLDGGAVYQTG